MDNTSPSGFIAVAGVVDARADVLARLRHAVPGRGLRHDPSARDPREASEGRPADHRHARTSRGAGGISRCARDADLSVTICQINALRAARNAGLYVPKETVDACIRYVKRSQNPDGGFRYMLQGGASAFPRSAAGVVALQSAGEYDTKEVRDGIAYLRQYTREIKLGNRYSHYFYGHYYAAQAMWLRGGDDWAEWYPAIRDELIRRQSAVGLLDRQHLQRVRHGHGAHHPPDSQQLPADLSALKRIERLRVTFSASNRGYSPASQSASRDRGA